jgi:hypothetical protein
MGLSPGLGVIPDPTIPFILCPIINPYRTQKAWEVIRLRVVLRRSSRISSVRRGKVLAADDRVRVVRAEEPFTVGEVGLVQGDGVGGAPSGLVGPGKVVAAAQSGGVVRAEEPFAVGEVGLQ